MNVVRLHGLIQMVSIDQIHTLLNFLRTRTLKLDYRVIL